MLPWFGRVEPLSVCLLFQRKRAPVVWRRAAQWPCVRSSRPLRLTRIHHMLPSPHRPRPVLQAAGRVPPRDLFRSCAPGRPAGGKDGARVSAGLQQGCQLHGPPVEGDDCFLICPFKRGGARAPAGLQKKCQPCRPPVWWEVTTEWGWNACGCRTRCTLTLTPQPQN